MTSIFFNMTIKKLRIHKYDKHANTDTKNMTKNAPGRSSGAYRLGIIIKRNDSEKYDGVKKERGRQLPGLRARPRLWAGKESPLLR